MGKDTGFSDMVFATIDRIEDEVLVLVTHTEPNREIHLPRELFRGVAEGDIVRIIVEKDEEKKEEIEKKIEDQRKRLKRVNL